MSLMGRHPETSDERRLTGTTLLACRHNDVHCAPRYVSTYSMNHARNSARADRPPCVGKRGYRPVNIDLRLWSSEFAALLETPARQSAAFPTSQPECL